MFARPRVKLIKLTGLSLSQTIYIVPASGNPTCTNDSGKNKGNAYFRSVRSRSSSQSE